VCSGPRRRYGSGEGEMTRGMGQGQVGAGVVSEQLCSM
jgi:hypothetical protein